MKVSLPNDSKQSVGGGWTFKRNLEKGLRRLGVEVIEDYTRADVALVSGTTMVTKETIQRIKDAHTKLVVRLDNVPRNSRNRNTGTSRLKGFSDLADAIVWQSEWARDYLYDFIAGGKPTSIIHNGVDEDIFHPQGASLDFHAKKEDTYLYVRSSRDETKNWEVAWYEFQMIARANPEAKLIIVGKFSNEHQEYNFDFFRGEKIQFLGTIEDPEYMARIMRGCSKFFAVYYNDCFSNTYLEALACGLQPVAINRSGGTGEMLDRWYKEEIEGFTLGRMSRDYLSLFEHLLS